MMYFFLLMIFLAQQPEVESPTVTGSHFELDEPQSPRVIKPTVKPESPVTTPVATAVTTTTETTKVSTKQEADELANPAVDPNSIMVWLGPLMIAIVAAWTGFQKWLKDRQKPAATTTADTPVTPNVASAAKQEPCKQEQEFDDSFCA
jgi:hypothetical protein